MLSFNSAHLIQDLEDFRHNQTNDVLATAFKGWHFALAADEPFLFGEMDHKFLRPPSQIASNLPEPDAPQVPVVDDGGDFFDRLAEIRDLKSRWRFVLNTVSMNNAEMLHDSFISLTGDDERISAVKEHLSRDKINLVILGAGCAGLVLANVLKRKLGDAVSLVVCENRGDRDGVKKPYSRNWLTNIPLHLIEGVVEPELVDLFRSFGAEAFMGVPIHVFETFLFLSCKKRGVKFYVNPDLDTRFIEATKAHLVVDATGAKIDHLYSADNGPENFTVSADLKNNSSSTQTNKTLDFNLVKINGRHYPHYKGNQLKYAMFKITGIPINFYEPIIEFVKKQNEDNLFYVWPGKLAAPINEIIIILNIDPIYYERLFSVVSRRIPLEPLMKIDHENTNLLDPRISSLFTLLSELNSGDREIWIERPFLWEPHIKLGSGKLPQIHNVPAIPIGDSFYCGHVKVGNGLSHHLTNVRQLADCIMESLLNKQAT